MVDRQKIEINIAHNFFYSLALTDFNNHLIFTVVDEKKLKGFTLTAMLKNKSSAFLGSLLSIAMMYRLGKATQSVILFIYVAIVFVLGI